MKNQLEISYENMGISSYLTVTFPFGTEVVGYQIEMITNNEINHLLAASKRTVDGETVVYYNISSRMALSQVLERRRVTRDEFIRLVETAVKASRDVKEYQLTEDCLVMEPDYIYVDPASCEPSFLYLPVISDGEGGLKKFLTDMVMQGRIEMGSDNFIQAVLETVNARPFSLDKLESCLTQFKSSSTPHVSAENKTAGSYILNAGSSSNNQNPSGGEPGGSRGKTSEEMQIRMAAEVPDSIGRNQEQTMNGQPPLPVPPSGSKARGKKEGRQKPAKEKKRKTEAYTDQDGFDPEKAKKKFLIPQAAVMVVLAALISFGAFKDKNGGIVLNHVLAAVLCVAVAEIILYREIYVNGKNGSRKEKQADANCRKPEKSGKKAGPPLPDQGKTEAGSMNQPVREGGKPKPPVSASIPAIPSPVNVYSGMAETEIGGETELWDSSEEGLEAYLEYYENGLMTRVALDKPSTLVGRLQSQVDFAIADPRVGKVHAEFVNQDGKIYVKDLNSKNGTYLNGNIQRLNSNMLYPLNDNDRIALAKSEFVLHCSVSQG